MIHEEICTYDVCKLAKEKGFREMANCYQGYRKDGTLFYFSNIPDGKERVMQTDCLAPTQSLLQRWLREKKGVMVEITIWLQSDGSWRYRYKMQTTKEVISSLNDYDTYELALEDALKYALENLV